MAKSKIKNADEITSAILSNELPSNAQPVSSAVMSALFEENDYPNQQDEQSKSTVKPLNEQEQEQMNAMKRQEALEQGEITTTVDHKQAIEQLIENRKRTVILKPIPRSGSRLGLEKTQEQFLAMPGTNIRWSASKKGNKYLTGLDKISRTKRYELEEELGYKLDNEFYSNLSFLLDRNRQIGERLNLEDAYDYVVYLAMTESFMVASSLAEYRKTNRKPYAEFYFEDVEAEVLAEAEDMKFKDRARDIIKESSELKQRWMAKALGINVFNLSNGAVNIRLRKYLEDDPRTAVDHAKQLISLWEKGETFIRVSALVKDAIATNVIRRTPARDYAYGEANLGATEEAAITKLMSPEGDVVRLAIQERVKFSQDNIKI